MAQSTRYFSNSLHRIINERYDSIPNASKVLKIHATTVRKATSPLKGVSLSTAESISKKLSLDFQELFSKVEPQSTYAEAKADINGLGERESFEQEVCWLFEQMGYETARLEEESNYQFDFLTRRSELVIGEYQVGIDCKFSSDNKLVADEDISRLVHALPRISRGIVVVIVSNTGFTDSCLELAEQNGIRCQTLAALQNEALDVRGYLHAIIAAQPQSERLIELDLKQHTFDGIDIRISDRALTQEFFANQSENVLAIIGEFGSGKTTLCRMIASEMATAYLEQKLGSRIPVVIPCRDLDWTLPVLDIICQSLDRVPSKSWSRQIVEFLDRQGKLLLIFDGVDEAADPGWTLQQIQNQSLGELSKIVLTCRTYVFHQNVDYKKLPARRTAVFEIMPLDMEQIHQFLTMSGSDLDDERLRKEVFENSFNRSFLAARPLLLEIAVRLVQDLDFQAPLTAPVLFETFLIQSLRRSLRSTASESVLEELTQIAVAMYLSDRSAFSAQEFRTINPDEVAKIPFLNSDRSGSIQFANKSMLEYLVARAIANSSPDRKVQILSERLLSRETAYFLAGLAEANSSELNFPNVGNSEVLNENIDLLRLLTASNIHHKLSKISIKELRLSRIKCFENVIITFNSGDSPATVIVGDNGHGKSTILQCIALCGLGPEGAARLVPSPERFLRQGAKSGLMTARFEVFGIKEGERSTDVTITLEVRKGSRSFELVNAGENASVNHEAFLKARDDTQFAGMFMAGYGATRIIEHSDEMSVSSIDDALLDRVDSLFKPRKLLIEPESLSRLLIGDGTPFKRFGCPAAIPQRSRTEILTIIKKLLPTEIIPVNTKNEMVNCLGATMISDLSDGYRCTLAWASHLIIHLCSTIDWQPGVKDLSGILLIDELDLHLHPKWQRVVMSLIRDAFPSLQIITTTHSPLVVADADSNEADLLSLKLIDDRVSVVRNISPMRGMRADQILATEIFDYLIDRDPKTEERLRHASILGGKVDRTPKEEVEYQALINSIKSAVVADGHTSFERNLTEMVDNELRSRAAELEEKLFGGGKTSDSD